MEKTYIPEEELAGMPGGAARDVRCAAAGTPGGAAGAQGADGGQSKQPLASMSQIGATLEALASTIAARRGAGEKSYTYRLLNGSADEPLKKVAEEANEVGLAGKDVESARAMLAAVAGHEGSHAGMVAGLQAQESAACDHLRYEAADVVYHLLVVLERYGIGIDEFAAELNNRMTDEERPQGAIRLHEEFVRRGHE